MRLACPYQLSPTQNLIAGGMQASARNAAAYLPSDNPTSLVGWFRMGVGVTSSGGFASAWADQSGNGNDLLQATGTNQPAYDGSAILTFDGIDNFMKCVAFTLNQPEQVSMLFSQVSWTSADSLFDGDTGGNKMRIFQWTASPRIDMYAGNFGPNSSGMVIGSFSAVTALFNGASSSLKVDSAVAATGNVGANNAAGFVLGNNGVGTASSSNIAVKEIIIRNVADATIRADDHAYLQTL